MLIGCIEDSNILLKGNGADVGDIRAIRTDCGFITAWIPTPDELAALNAGAPVYLTVWGDAHPPVYVEIKQK